MADTSGLPPELQLFELTSQPGVRRDGTDLDSPYYNDGIWVRWQRGRPRKMGGYRAMSTLANGQLRSMLVDSRNGINTVHAFSQWGVQRLQFSPTGAGGNLDDRTPFGYTPNSLNHWSQGVMTSSTGGKYSALLACVTPDVEQIDSDTPGFLYTGDMATNAPLTVVSDSVGPIQVSGGVCILQPFCVVYGSAGNIRNSNPNDFSNSATLGWTVGPSSFANNANVAGTKFIYGAPVRGGSQAPAGLFWALDAVVRMTFVGGTNLWQYDTLQQPTSILGKKGVVEHDGQFFWPGTDRFLFYNGVIQELPNQMNCNYFFDNLNYAERNKVWGTKIPRWKEIWWFYPRGSATECTDAVIYNYEEQTWYDARLTRQAGGNVQLFPFPIWGGSEDSQQTTALTVGLRLQLTAPTASGNSVLTFASTTGVANGMSINGLSGDGVPSGATVASFTGTTITMSAPATAIIPSGEPIVVSSMNVPTIPGQTVTGATSGSTGKVVRATFNQINLINVAGAFTNTESLTYTGGSATSMGTPFTQELDTIYQHETGTDKVVGSNVSAIPSSFTSQNIGFAIGQPIADAQNGVNATTRITQVQPDFVQSGNLVMTVLGKSFAPQDYQDLVDITLAPNTPFMPVRNAQARILQVQFTSNEIGGNYNQGKIMLGMEPGDERSDNIIT